MYHVQILNVDVTALQSSLMLNKLPENVMMPQRNLKVILNYRTLPMFFFLCRFTFLRANFKTVPGCHQTSNTLRGIGW